MAATALRMSASGLDRVVAPPVRAVVEADRVAEPVELPPLELLAAAVVGALEAVELNAAELNVALRDMGTPVPRLAVARALTVALSEAMAEDAERRADDTAEPEPPDRANWPE